MYRGRGNEDVEVKIDARAIIKPRNNVPTCTEPVLEDVSLSCDLSWAGLIARNVCQWGFQCGVMMVALIYDFVYKLSTLEAPFGHNEPSSATPH